jgi:hypothetical protein
MKKQVFRVFVCLVFYTIFTGYCVAQTPVTIYTPHGSVVPDTYTFTELTQAQIASQNSYVSQAYPNATKLSDASATYNCHAYAWYTSEGGSNVWIGATTSTAEDVFWTDGSYIENGNQIYPAKVSYASDNHSATTTNQADIFISKWGSLPLMQHNKNYCPYNSSNLKYYIKTPPTISGPSQLCNQGTYNINGLSGATVVWSATPSGIVSIQQNGNTATVTKVGSGTITLSATINNSVTITKNIWIGLQASFTGSASVNYLGTGTWNSNVSCGVEPYIFQWWLRKANSGVASMCVSNDPEITLRSVDQGTAKTALSAKPPVVNQPISSTIFYMFLRVTDANGFQYDTPEQQIYAYGKVDLVPAFLLKMNDSTQDINVNQVSSLDIYPNPSSNEVQININQIPTTSLSSMPSSVNSNNAAINSYSVNVIDIYGNNVYTNKKVGEQFTISTAGFRNGVYTITVSNGSNTYQNKLIVKH